jgi:hypothetical protein
MTSEKCINTVFALFAAHVRLKMNIYKKKHIMNYDDNIFDK